MGRQRDELIEMELAGGREAAGEQVQEREPERRCGHVERSPVPTSGSSPGRQRPRSHLPSATIAEPSCWHETMPQEGTFIERMFAATATEMRRIYVISP